MINSKSKLVEALENYHSDYPEERQFAKQFLSLLNHPGAFLRDHLPGHITGSAWIIDQAGESVLLTHHAKLNRWLQPGGHADGDEDITGVALKEATEETGLSSLTLVRETIFDIDIHLIPERKGFSQHFHYDIRFLLSASRDEMLSITEESNDLQWVELTSLPKFVGHERSLIRMLEKVKLQKVRLL